LAQWNVQNDRLNVVAPVEYSLLFLWKCKRKNLITKTVSAEPVFIKIFREKDELSFQLFELQTKLSN